MEASAPHVIAHDLELHVQSHTPESLEKEFIPLLTWRVVELDLIDRDSRLN
jgi:hypothetical protein